MKRRFIFISVLAVSAAFVFTACGANVFEATEEDKGATPVYDADEKQRFIDATVEMTCMMIEAEDLVQYLSAENRPAVNKKLAEIYERHGFDIADSDKMEAMAEKYKDDDEVFEEIQLGLMEC